MYEPTEEERKQEHKRRVEAKMKSLMEERAGEELMPIEEIVKKSREIIKAFDDSSNITTSKGK